jgi:outer membrane protein assembly factor BamA
MVIPNIYGATVIFNNQVDANSQKKIDNYSNITFDLVYTTMVDAGYLDAAISQSNDTIFITSNDQYQFDKMYVDGVLLKTNSIGTIFHQVNVEKNVMKFLEQKKNEGFLFSRLSVNRIIKNKNTVDVYFSSDLGPQLRINNIKYDGLNRTPREIVDIYVRQMPDSILNKSNLEKLTDQAKSIDFLEYSPPPKILPLAGYDKADIVFDFREKKQAIFEGGFGYLPETSTVVWNIDLNFQNVFGYGRKFGLKSDHRDKNRQLFEISYSQPIFLISTDVLSFSVATRDYRESFYEFSANGSYKTNLSNRYSVGLLLGWKSLKPDGELPDYKIFTSGIIAGYSNFDNNFNPTTGIRLDWSIEYQNRQNQSDSGVVAVDKSSYNETRNQIELEYIQKISYPVITRWQLNYRSLETSESLPPLSELFLLGGSSTIRGFNTEQFSALRTAFLNFDLRYRIKSGYLFGFYDIAYLNNHILSSDLDVITDEFYRFGYGFGISLLRKSQFLRLSVGWNKDIPFDQPYLTIGVSSEI